MKAYALDPQSYKNNDIGCCPGHDWPILYRYVGKYSSPHSQRTASKKNKQAKRIRRHREKQRLIRELIHVE